jgi:hypothetical protein
MTLSLEERENYLQLLVTHRRTLAHLLEQAAAYGGEVLAPPQTANSIASARNEIKDILLIFRADGIEIDNHPDDDDLKLITSLPRYPRVATPPTLFPTRYPRVATPPTLFPTQVSPQPPKRVEYLLWFFPKKFREDTIGDLAEEYITVHGRYGETRANIWYYYQVIFSIWIFRREKAQAKRATKRGD